jgi:hypothetical protein
MGLRVHQTGTRRYLVGLIDQAPSFEGAFPSEEITMKKLLFLLATLLSVSAQAETVGSNTTETLALAPGQRLTVTTGATEAIVQRYNGALLVETTGPAASTTTIYGEYFVGQQFTITALSSPVTYEITQSNDAVRTGIFTVTGGTIDDATITDATITDADITGGTIDEADITGGTASDIDITMSVITTSEVTDTTAFSLIENIQFLPVVGAPDDAVQGTLSRNPAGDDNALTFTAVAYGAIGNATTVTYVDPEANDAELSVVVTGSSITVNLATGEAGAITSTAAQILTAIEASAPASALVTVAIDATDSGEADDGSGVVTALSLGTMSGGAGTGIGTAGTGSIAIDYDNGKLYINSGTMAVPVWDLVTSS